MASSHANNNIEALGQNPAEKAGENREGERMKQALLLLLLACLVTFQAAARSGLSRAAVLRSFHQGSALKIISGLTNFDSALVENVVAAANAGGATHVDIACDPALVKVAKAAGPIPVCVSSIDPPKFVAAVAAGADMIEIGNFDGFYPSGQQFPMEKVLQLATETRKLLPGVPLSVTIPHTLALRDQIQLAQQLELLQVDILQTEGKYSASSASLGVQQLIERAAPALASAYALSRAVRIPVLCSSGISDVTAPLALAAGARGVGVGSMVNTLKNVHQMTMAVRAVAESIGRDAPSSEADWSGQWRTAPEPSDMTMLAEASPLAPHAHPATLY